MQIKTLKPINFIFFRTETKLNDLAAFLPVGQELFREAVAQNVAITGPIQWFYAGFTGDPNVPFTLEVALPVAEFPKDYDGKFHVKRTEPFKCVSTVHDGPWMELPATYAKILAFMGEHQLTPDSQTREVYINVDFNDPLANVTEVQFGIR